jgi:hypothetical protein
VLLLLHQRRRWRLPHASPARPNEAADAAPGGGAIEAAPAGGRWRVASRAVELLLLRVRRWVAVPAACSAHELALQTP